MFGHRGPIYWDQSSESFVHLGEVEMPTPGSDDTLVLDPRFKNRSIDGSKISTFLLSYTDLFVQGMKAVPAENLDAALHLLEDAAEQGATIYVAGNGGSASISDHFCCDWTKGTSVKHLSSIKTHSLVANNALLTALANDLGYEDVFSKQLEMLSKPGDLLVLVSSSGNSKNVINAAKAARKLRLKSIGLTGFSGGELAKICDASLHVPIDNYGIVEDCHQSLMHILAQFTARKRDLR